MKTKDHTRLHSSPAHIQHKEKEPEKDPSPKSKTTDSVEDVPISIEGVDVPPNPITENPRVNHVRGMSLRIEMDRKGVWDMRLFQIDFHNNSS